MLATIFNVVAIGTWAVSLAAFVDAQGDPFPKAPRTRLGGVPTRHAGGIRASALAPDGKTLATAGGGVHAVVLWDLETSKALHRLRGAHGDAYIRPGLAFSPDGSHLAYLQGPHFGYIWDVLTGTEIHRFVRRDNDGNGDLGSSCRFINGGKQLLIAIGQTIQTFDLASKRFVASIPAAGTEISSDGRFFFQIKKDVLILGDVATGKDAARMNVSVVHDGCQNGLAYAPDGKSFVLLHDGKEIQHRKLPGGEILATMSLPKSATQLGSGYRFAFAADGQTLLIGMDAGAIHRLDLGTGQERASLGKYASGVRGMHALKDGRTLISTDSDGAIHHWDLTTGRHRREPNLSRFGVVTAFSANGQWAAVGDSRRIDFWDVRAGKPVGAIRRDGPGPIFMFFSVPWPIVVDSQVHADLWGSPRRQPIGTSPSGGDDVIDVAFVPGDKLMATAARSGTVSFWQAPSGAPKATWRPDPSLDSSTCRGIHFSPDGRLFAISFLVTPDWRPSPVLVVEIASQKVLWKGEGMAKGFSPDGASLVVARPTEPFFSIVDAKTGQTRSTVRLKSEAPDFKNDFRIAFAPDGRQMAVVYDGHVAAFCDGRTGEERRRLPDADVIGYGTHLRVDGGIGSFSKGAIRNQPRALAFSTDGKWLASGGTDGFISIWEVATGHRVLRLTEHSTTVAVVAFHADSRTICSFDQDGEGSVWSLTPKSPAGPRPAIAELWDALNQPDAAAAYRAQWQMVAAKNAAPFLKQQLTRPAVAPDKTCQWITDVDSPKFPVRDAATKALEDAGAQVLGPIQKALAGETSLETRRRLEQIAKRLDIPIALRAGRAIQVLELIGTPEARAVLEGLAGGAPGARETEEAKASFERVSRRVSQVP